MSVEAAALEPATVNAFVGNAHGDIDAVRAALAGEPRLANAAWDWGGGDWETALGAAGHMGRRTSRSSSSPTENATTGTSVAFNPWLPSSL